MQNMQKCPKAKKTNRYRQKKKTTTIVQVVYVEWNGITIW